MAQFYNENIWPLLAAVAVTPLVEQPLIGPRFDSSHGQTLYLSAIIERRK